MFQIIFTQTSAAEMAALPKPLQLEILSEFQVLPEHIEPESLGEHFGVLQRDGRTIYRYRTREYRIYFAPVRDRDGLVIHRVLNKNTLEDFLFRSNLAGAGEDASLEKNPHFWALLGDEPAQPSHEARP